jgi:hypothetical protein
MLTTPTRDLGCQVLECPLPSFPSRRNAQLKPWTLSETEHTKYQDYTFEAKPRHRPFVHFKSD